MGTTLIGGADAKLEGESEARAWNPEEGEETGAKEALKTP